MACARELRTGLLLLLGCLAPPNLHAGETVIRHSTYEDFVQGSLGDGGARTYISRRGRVQLIPRWDLNRDGYLDVVFNQDHNPVENVDAFIYWGSAEGYRSLFPPFWKEVLPTYKLFQSLGENRRHSSFLPTFGGGPVRVADLNRDGWPDIVVANYGEESGHRQGYRLHRESYVYWGAPDGFSAERRTSIPTLSAISCTVGDFDGARRLDLEAGNPRLVRAADLDLDGRDDLVVFSGKTRSAFFDADRTERSHLDSGSAGLLLFQVSEGRGWGRPRRLPAEEVREVIARDLDGDGHVDLTLAGQVADQGSEVTGSAIYWGSGTGFDPGRRTVLPTLSPGSVASADLNRDGHIDLVFANAETSKTHDPPSHIYWGSEQGFHPARRSHLQGFGAGGVAAADLNRDGHPEIVLMNRLSGRKAGEIPSLIFWGNSAHHYSEANAALIPAPAKPYFSKVADFDDDGYPDLVFSGVSPFLLWGGPRGFVRTFRFGLDARTTGIDVADYDRDGYLDVIFLMMSRDPSVRHYGLIYLGGADGFSGARTLRVALRAYKSLYLATADLDRDGFLDLIFGGTETPDQLSEIVWGGRSGFSQRPSTLLKTNWVNVPAVADLDRNGWLDIVFPSRMDALTQSTHTRSLIMWGGGDGYSEKNRTELEAFNASVIRVSDLNRDGSLDLGACAAEIDLLRKR